MNEDTTLKLFIVDTISTFRHRYVVEAMSLEHAMDEVTMIDSGNTKDCFEPFSQTHLGEQIIDGRKISEDKFLKMNEALRNPFDKREIGNPWMGEKMIRRIDYSSPR